MWYYLSEYGSDWDSDEVFYETNKKREEDKNKEIKSEEINKNWVLYKETEDPFENIIILNHMKK